MFVTHVSCSSSIAEYIFNSFFFSKGQLNTKLSNIYLIKGDERNNDESLFKDTEEERHFHSAYRLF